MTSQTSASRSSAWRKLKHSTRSRSSLRASIGEMSVAQIKLPLDPAPRLVFQLAATIAIVDRLSLRLDQLKLYLVVGLGELPAAAVATASVLDLSQPFAEMRAVRPDNIVQSWRSPANWPSRSIAASIARRRATNSSSLSAWRSRHPARARPEQAEHSGQHQALSHQGATQDH